MSSIKNSSSSLRWAIDELSKQKDDLSSKLKIAKKRDDTNSLIAEVEAQKDALSKRISSLEQGLQVSSKLVEKPVSSIEFEINQVNDKLEIAKDRLNKLEQEEYLEELGKKLNGDLNPDQKSHKISETTKDFTLDLPNLNDSLPNTTDQEIKSEESVSTESENYSHEIMKATTNRIDPKSEEESSTLRIQSNIESVEKSEPTSPTCDFKNLEECANHLGVDQEFLHEQGMQAILRMIARNGNKISFPLEVDQID